MPAVLALYEDILSDDASLGAAAIAAHDFRRARQR